MIFSYSIFRVQRIEFKNDREVLSGDASRRQNDVTEFQITARYAKKVCQSAKKFPWRASRNKIKNTLRLCKKDSARDLGRIRQKIRASSTHNYWLFKTSYLKLGKTFEIKLQQNSGASFVKTRFKPRIQKLETEVFLKT